MAVVPSVVKFLRRAAYTPRCCRARKSPSATKTASKNTEAALRRPWWWLLKWVYLEIAVDLRVAISGSRGGLAGPRSPYLGRDGRLSSAGAEERGGRHVRNSIRQSVFFDNPERISAPEAMVSGRARYALRSQISGSGSNS